MGPPTADQPGLIGANWSKGGSLGTASSVQSVYISNGKEGSTGHLYRSIRKDKPGYQYQLESVLRLVERMVEKKDYSHSKYCL